MSLFTGGMIIYVENSKEWTKTAETNKQLYSKVVGYNINIQSITFPIYQQ